MVTQGNEVHRWSPAVLTGGVALVAAGFTVAVVVLPFVAFAYRAPALHVVLETANAIVAVLVAYLIYGRFRQSARLQELLLLLALCAVAVANLALTAVPFALTFGRDEGFSRWAPLAVRLLATLLLVAAALVPTALQVRPQQAAFIVLSLIGVVVAVSAAGVAWGERLPPPVDPGVALGDASRPLLVAHPVVLGVQGAGAVLYAVAAVAFTRQAGRTADELIRWVAAGCVLASFARAHYLLYPSLYSDYVYTGDLLRLGFYLFMLVGAAREITSYWELRTRAAVLEDRRRMARDLHDGLTQELSYIWSQSLRLAAHPGDPVAVERIGGAAGRALDEARRAIAALTRPLDESFAQVLEQVVEEMASRYDVSVVADLDPSTVVSPAQGEALLRIVGEAVRNAALHGAAKRIDVAMTADPLCLMVTDDGRGMTVDRLEGRSLRGFGITSMRERAEGMGAVLRIKSAAGEGTTVQVSWP